MEKGIDAMMEESLEEEYSKMNEIESARILVERDEWRGMMLDTVHLFEETGLTPQTLRDIADELAGALSAVASEYNLQRAAHSDKSEALVQATAALARYKKIKEGE